VLTATWARSSYAGLADYDRRPFDTVEACLPGQRLMRADRYERLVYCSSTRLDGQRRPKPRGRTAGLQPGRPAPVDLSKALGENLTLARSGGRSAVARLQRLRLGRRRAGLPAEWLIAARATRDLKLDRPEHRARLHPPGRRGRGPHRIATGGGVPSVAAGRWRPMPTSPGCSRPPAGGEVHRPANHTPPNAVADRLADLGVRARPVKDVVAGYLEG
jgi:hypothetical protein